MICSLSKTLIWLWEEEEEEKEEGPHLSDLKTYCMKPIQTHISNVAELICIEHFRVQLLLCNSTVSSENHEL